ncbi:maleylpyruvate isomerase family mycothiol-dependent enzyme [Pseudonocardia sp. CA-107938]|uniref:maleylpyruvate isomerase family mycothiol-dependent enzyme n=1 Tax=Pseudonocardia sp. CA-107938 TaxID=3240021 RepID=UPI003D8F2984
MDADTIWATVATERRYLADVLDGLSVTDWDRPSLCSEWRIRDVVAHVAWTPQPPGPWDMLTAAVRHRFAFNAMNRDMAIGFAQERTPQQLVDQLRRYADVHRKPFVTTMDNLLFDTVVHVQDVAMPFGIEHAVPEPVTTAALDRVWAMGWPFHARRRLQGLRLVATDTGWTGGAGPVEVRGPALALLLTMTGRPAGHAQLDGPGVAELANR